MTRIKGYKELERERSKLKITLKDTVLFIIGVVWFYVIAVGVLLI